MTPVPGESLLRNVPEGRCDRSLARSAWDSATPKSRPVGYGVIRAGVRTDSMIGVTKFRIRKLKTFMFGVWRLAFGVWRLAFGVRRSAFGVRRSRLGVRRRRLSPHLSPLTSHPLPAPHFLPNPFRCGFAALCDLSERRKDRESLRVWPDTRLQMSSGKIQRAWPCISV